MQQGFCFVELQSRLVTSRKAISLELYEDYNILLILPFQRILYPQILFHYTCNSFECKLSRFLPTQIIDFDICWHSPHSFLFQWNSINVSLREYHAFVPSLKICQSYLKYFNFVNKKTVHISKYQLSSALLHPKR